MGGILDLLAFATEAIVSGLISDEHFEADIADSLFTDI